METISISKLKTHLSAELKRIESGIALTVVDHKRPVAMLSPIRDDALFVREAASKYAYEPLAPLVVGDPLVYLDEERGTT